MTRDVNPDDEKLPYKSLKKRQLDRIWTKIFIRHFTKKKKNG